MMHPPELDSPYSPGAWRQPPREAILIDETHALMTKDVFEQLSEYSASMPTGVYPGKMWRRKELAWYLMWYGPVDANKCSINHREILLA